MAPRPPRLARTALGRRCRGAASAAALAGAALLLAAGGTALVAPCVPRGGAGRPPPSRSRVARLAEPQEVVLKPGMTVDEYLSASGFDPKVGADPGIPFIDWLPPLNELTPGWIATYFILPALAFFVVNLFSTPLQDKLFFGEEYEIDWSGRSGRLWKLFFGGGDPLAVPDQPTEMKIGGDLEELRRRRAKEEGLMADFTRPLRPEAPSAEQEAEAAPPAEAEKAAKEEALAGAAGKEKPA